HPTLEHVGEIGCEVTCVPHNGAIFVGPRSAVLLPVHSLQISTQGANFTFRIVDRSECPSKPEFLRPIIGSLNPVQRKACQWLQLLLITKPFGDGQLSIGLP